MVWRMIGRDRVDAAIGESLQQCVAIGGFPQRRIHLDVRIVAHRRGEQLIRQREVMRCDFAGDPNATCFADSHGVERSSDAHMCDMHVPARELREGDVTLRHDGLRGRGDPAKAEQ